MGKLKDFFTSNPMSIEDLQEGLIEILEKNNQDSYRAMAHVEGIKSTHNIYNTETSIKNNIQRLKNAVKDKDTKKEIDNLYTTYKNSKKNIIDRYV